LFQVRTFIKVEVQSPAFHGQARLEESAGTQRNEASVAVTLYFKMADTGKGKRGTTVFAGRGFRFVVLYH
jgi:hypothetical protein